MNSSLIVRATVKLFVTDLTQVSLDTYDLLAYIATALVFVGVVGESLPELFDFPKAERVQALFRKISLSILILGLAGELLAGSRVSQLTRVLIAKLNADARASSATAAQANADAAKASAQQGTLRKENLRLQKQLEHERTERLKLAQDMAPRYFVFQVWPKLKLFGGVRFLVSTVQDPEAERLARLIDETLRQAGWTGTGPLMVEENVNRLTRAFGSMSPLGTSTATGRLAPFRTFSRTTTLRRCQ